MALREILAKFGIEVDQSGLKKADASVNKVAEALGGLAQAAAGTALIGGIAHFTQSMIDMGSELDDQSNRLGVTSDELQSLRFAAGQAGASAEELGSGLKILNKTLADASEGGAAAQEFAKLGINVKDASGKAREATDVIGDVAEALKKADTQTERAGIAMKFFGKGGLALLPMLKDGKEGVDALTKRFKELGGGLSKEFVKAADDAGDAQAELKIGFLSLKSSIGVVLLPMVTKIVQKITDLIIRIQKVTKGTGAFKVGLGILGAASVVTGLKLAAGVGAKLGMVGSAAGGASSGILGTVTSLAKLARAGVNVGLPLIALFLILEDLYTLFTGGHSVIGQFIDSMFGVGASKKFVEDVKVAFGEAVEIFKSAVPAVRFVARELALFLKDAFTGFHGFRKMISEFWEFFSADAAKAWEKVKQGFAEGLQSIGQTILDFQRKHPVIMGILNVATGGALLPSVVGAAENLANRPIGEINQGRSGVSQQNETTINVTAPNPGDAARQVQSFQRDVNSDNAAALGAVARP